MKVNSVVILFYDLKVCVYHKNMFDKICFFLKVLETDENDAGNINDTWLGSCQFDSNMKSSIQIQMKSKNGQDTKVLSSQPPFSFLIFFHKFFSNWVFLRCYLVAAS